ncbi:bacterial regulatory helix-turn-helix, lysR family protein, partial [Vibrio parahaemolyticus V-223/04]
FVVKIRKSA